MSSRIGTITYIYLRRVGPALGAALNRGETISANFPNNASGLMDAHPLSSSFHHWRVLEWAASLTTVYSPPGKLSRGHLESREPIPTSAYLGS